MFMRNIAELDMLVRARVDLPAGLRLATKVFCRSAEQQLILAHEG